MSLKKRNPRKVYDGEETNPNWSSGFDGEYPTRKPEDLTEDKDSRCNIRKSNRKRK